MIDITKLTMGEIAKVEDLSGQPISAIGNDASPKGLALAALAFVTKKRHEPAYTWNDAQLLTLEDVNAILGLDESEETDPLDSSDASSTPKESPAKK